MPFQPSLLGRGCPAGAPLRAVAGRAFARRRATHNQHTQCATARRRVRGRFLPISDGTNPSPVVLRLVKAPEADTLSPRERAESRAWGTPAICRNEVGMSMKKKDHAISALSFGERVSGGGAFTSRRWTGLRPPKGYAQSAYSMCYGPQAGEGSLPAHLGRN
jgi:hypothetical protein